MNLTHVDHIAIESNDIEKSVRWYKNNFSCKIKHQDNTWALIGFKNIQIALVTPGQHPPHFAVIDQNIILNKDTVKHRDGSVSKYIQDLDNNKIELIKYEKDNS